MQRRIVDDERVRYCSSSFIEHRDRATQQRERFRIFDDIHSMKILLYLRLQFFLRVLISRRNCDDDDDVHSNYLNNILTYNYSNVIDKTFKLIEKNEIKKAI